MPGPAADGGASQAGTGGVDDDRGRPADRQAVREVIAAAALDNLAVRNAGGQLGDVQSTLDSLMDSVLSDPDRVAALERTGLLDDPPRLALDQFAALAAEALGTHYAAVSLVDPDEQVIVGCNVDEGFVRRRPLEQSICKYAVASGEPMIVDDASEHPLLAGNPMVQDGSVRSYAGIPLIDQRGHAVGTLCAWDGQPRHWTGSQIQILEDLTAVARAKIFVE
jgi:putative methionine-R-sulfoxide reductase with GAF domain